MSTVSLSPYSPDWPDVFAQVRAEVPAVFPANDIDVEHAGSKSVPGLAAKPAIDALLVARLLEQMEAGIIGLGKLGFEYRPSCEHEIPERRYFVKSKWGTCVSICTGWKGGSRLHRSHLLFRDALRSDRTLMLEYQALKQRLAVEHAGDEGQYTAAEATFIERALLERCVAER